MPRGYLTDAGAHQIENAIERFLDSGFKKYIINFSNVELITTRVISILKNILQKTVASGCRVCFTNMSELHLEIFELTGLMQRVYVFQDEDDAMAFLRKTNNFL